MWWNNITYRKTRVIPVLLLENKGLYKTIKFGNPTYLGDPVNILKIFNEKGVDELLLLSYRSSKNKVSTDFNYLEKVLSEVRYPLTYGGNISSLSQMESIYRLGVEKIVVNSILNSDPLFLKKAVDAFGSSSVVGCLELRKKRFGKLHATCYSGEVKFKHSINEHISLINDSGVGEVIIMDVNNEGTMNGFNFELMKDIIPCFEMPVIISGGAGQTQDLIDFQSSFDVEAFGVGSMVVYQGKNKGVLINMPEEKELSKLK